MGQATAPRVQALISTSDNEWIKKHKPKGETVSKFVASLIAEAIHDKERRKKIGAVSGEAIHNLVIECAAQVEELNNLCQFYNRPLKEDIRHHLDGTQFEDGLFYDAFIKDSPLAAAPVAVQVSKTSQDSDQAAKRSGFEKLMDKLQELIHFVNVRKLQLDEGIVMSDDKENFERLLDEIKTRFLPTVLEQKVTLQTDMTRIDEYLASLRSLMKLLEECLAMVKTLQSM